MNQRAGRERIRRGGEDWLAGVQWVVGSSVEQVAAALRRTTQRGAGPGGPGGSGPVGPDRSGPRWAGRTAPPRAGGSLRVSDEERAQVAEALSQAVAEGRLDMDELSERVGLAWRARTADDLVPLVADLPAHLRVTPGDGAVPNSVSAVFREVRCEGEWEVPPYLRVVVTGGRAVLDLTRATVRSAEVVLDLAVAGGTVAVRVPAGVPVAVEDRLTVYGSWDNRAVATADGPPGAETTRVRLTGTVVGGRVAVTAAPAAEERRGRFRR